MNIKYSLFVAVAYYAGLSFLVHQDKISSIIIWISLILSITTFIAYGRDKSAAKKQEWRTPEITLHLLSLAGGWTGALIAQQSFRHKTRKTSFKIIFFITAVLNLAVIYLLYLLGKDSLLESLNKIVSPD